MMLAALLVAMPAATQPLALKPVEQRTRFSMPLASFFCRDEAARQDKGEWTALEVELNDQTNLFGVDRRPGSDGAPRASRIDDRIAEYGDAENADGSFSIFVRPDAKYALQFEMRIAAGATEIGIKTVEGFLTNTANGAQKTCMLVPNFSPIGSAP